MRNDGNTSVFSHQTFWHFLFNNVALWSIGGSALVLASRLSSPEGGKVAELSLHRAFLAFFATAGVSQQPFRTSSPRSDSAASCLNSLATARSTVGRQASLGASGAVYSALVMSACAFPVAQLGIIFFAFITFPIGVGVGGW